MEIVLKKMTYMLVLSEGENTVSDTDCQPGNSDQPWTRKHFSTSARIYYRSLHLLLVALPGPPTFEHFSSI